MVSSHLIFFEEILYWNWRDRQPNCDSDRVWFDRRLASFASRIRDRRHISLLYYKNNIFWIVNQSCSVIGLKAAGKVPKQFTSRWVILQTFEARSSTKKKKERAFAIGNTIRKRSYQRSVMRCVRIDHVRFGLVRKIFFVYSEFFSLQGASAYW